MNSVVFEQQLQQDVIAATGGDHDAFARLVGICRNTVCSIALAVTRDVASSEDIAQESFLAAWRNLSCLRNPSSFLPYLRQITRNLAHTHVREWIREPIDRGEFDLLIATTIDPAPDHSERLIQHEDEQVLAEAIDTLTEDAREAITLFYREGQSVAQVANLLGLQEVTVRKRLSRAREEIRTELLAHFARVAKTTAPSAAFSTLVMTLIGTASPPLAAATTMSLTSTLSKSVGGKLAIGLGGAMLGTLLGLAGLLFGLRKVFLRARDAQEKRDIKRMALLGSALIIVSSMFMSPIGPNNWIIPSAAFIMLSSGLGVLCLWWYPRITLRSRAAEVRNDPSAALRHRRERMRAFIGWALGTLAGGWGLFEGLMRISGLSP